MLILPPGHAQAARVRRPLTAREKWSVRAVAAALVVIAVVVVVSFTTGGPTSSNGCIHATIAGDVGAQQVSECGAAARNTCATVFQPGAFPSQAATVVADACRKAGLAVKR